MCAVVMGLAPGAVDHVPERAYHAIELGERLPDGILVEPVPLGDMKDGANLALSDLELQRAFEGGRDRVTVKARLINTGAAEQSTEAVLFINDDQSKVMKFNVLLE